MEFDFLNMAGDNLATLGQDIEDSLSGLWTWGKNILNILVILAAAYYGVSSVVKYFQGDSSAGKSVLLILVGILVWFAIIVPTVDSFMTSGGSAGSLPWE